MPDNSDKDKSDKDKSDKDKSDKLDSPFDELFPPNQNPFRRAPRSTTATGSGVIVRPDGFILTNDHIVETAHNGDVTVTLSDGTPYKGKVFRDTTSDLAVVKINPEKPLPFVKIADSSRVHVGQWAVAIGSPFGQQNTVTTGIVSALHRKREIGDGGETRLYPNLIQTDASINPGNSGGPLLNISGEMIGINVAIYSPTGTSLGIGYAIPSNTAKAIMEQLITKGKVVRGSLGVVPDDVPVGVRRRLGTTAGAYVKAVSPDTPADRAGIQVEDVITAFSSRPINDESDLREAISNTAPGTKVAITLLRAGKVQKISATLEARKDDAPQTQPDDARTKTRPMTELGFEAEPLTAELVAERKLPVGVKGLVVRDVVPGSLASQEGLVPGAIIFGVNGSPLSTTEALNQVIGKAKPSDTITLLTLRVLPNGKTYRAAVNITLP